MRRTLVLDLDGTLIDSVPDLMAALNRLATARGFAPYGRAQVAGWVGDGAGVLVRRAFAARGAEPTDDDLAGFVADYTANSAVETVPFPGVAETLGTFADDGWALAVCTNKPRAATDAVLGALGLSHWFAAIGGGDSFPVRKPDPAHLLATLAAAGGVPEAAVMVGDHHNDVRAAAGAGVPCVFAQWGYGAPEMAEGATTTAAHFTDLPALAAKLIKAAPP